MSPRVKSTPHAGKVHTSRVDDATVKAPKERRDSVPLLKPTRLRLRVKSTPLRVKSTLLKLAALSARRALAARDRTTMLHRILPCRSPPGSAPPSIVWRAIGCGPSRAGCSRVPETTKRRGNAPGTIAGWKPLPANLRPVRLRPGSPCPGALPENRADDGVKRAPLAQLA